MHKVYLISAKILTGFCIWVFFGNGVVADNWNTGSGGKSSRLSRSTEYGPENATILWQNGVSSVIAQQAVIDGNIVAMSRIFNINNVLHGTLIVAQDLMTGDTLWTEDLPVDFPATDWRNRVSAMKNGVVFATRSGNTNYSYLYALDGISGSIIWQSEGLINESSTESCAFATNGDLIVGNFDNIIRINAVNGATVWQTDRICPTSNGQEVSVYGSQGYYWEAAPAGPKVSVIDLETGNYLYSSESLSGGFIQQLGLFIGPDGTIYAPRSMNNPVTDFLFALKDNGSSLQQFWNSPIGYIPFSTSAIAPDGTIYTYSVAGEIIRLNPANGQVLNTSVSVFSTLGASPRMAIDAHGYVFVTNGEFATGKIYSFDPDLTLRWTENILNVNIGGPAIGAAGTMVICGVGTNVRAYQGSYSLQVGFTADATEICAEGTVQFTDQSNGALLTWDWSFEGGIPATSNLPDPQVIYPEPGDYDVTLTVSDGSNSSTLTLENFILVNELPVVSFATLPEYFCEGDDPYELTEGTPEGGTYSGPGVVNGFFYPDLAGVGYHTLSYYYVNEAGCGDTAFQSTYVMICDAIDENGPISRFKLFPNPAREFLTIQTETGDSGFLEIAVYSASDGRMISKKVFADLIYPMPATFPVSDLEPGMYLVKMCVNGQMKATGKFIRK